MARRSLGRPAPMLSGHPTATCGHEIRATGRFQNLRGKPVGTSTDQGVPQTRRGHTADRIHTPGTWRVVPKAPQSPLPAPLYRHSDRDQTVGIHPHSPLPSQASLPSPHSKPAHTPPGSPSLCPTLSRACAPTSLPVGVQNPSCQPGSGTPQEQPPGQVLSLTRNPSSLQKPPLRDPVG